MSAWSESRAWPLATEARSDVQSRAPGAARAFSETSQKALYAASAASPAWSSTLGAWMGAADGAGVGGGVLVAQATAAIVNTTRVATARRVVCIVVTPGSNVLRMVLSGVADLWSPCGRATEVRNMATRWGPSPWAVWRQLGR